MTTSTNLERLVAFTVLLVPDRAPRVLALLASPDGARAAERAARWATLSRRDRLSAASRILASSTGALSPPAAKSARDLLSRIRGAAVPGGALIARLHQDLARAVGARDRQKSDEIQASWHER